MHFKNRNRGQRKNIRLFILIWFHGTREEPECAKRAQQLLEKNHILTRKVRKRCCTAVRNTATVQACCEVSPRLSVLCIVTRKDKEAPCCPHSVISDGSVAVQKVLP